MKRLLNIYHNLKYKQKMLFTCILVGLIPLALLGTFCYHQTVRLLLNEEKDSMTNAVSTAYHTLDHQIQLYEDLITYLAHSETVVRTSSQHYDTISEKFMALNYEYDVLLSNIYAQHPEISQITLYVDRSDLFHGKQLRPLSDLDDEPWRSSLDYATQPIWHMDEEGYLCLFQNVPDPFIKFVSSYSDHCLCVRLDPEHFFNSTKNISNNYHLQIGSASEIVHDYTDEAIAHNTYPVNGWTTQVSEPLSNGWTITLEKPSFLLSAPANKMALIIFIVVLLCIILIFTVSNYLSDFFAQKVNRLLCAMHEIQKGDLTVRIHDDCPDEMGELTNSFQHMIDELNRLVVEDYKNKITLKETQFMALQAQINPHFLYNCLSLINSKALMNRQPEISQMAQLLSTFYRTTLNKGRSETLLANEIKNVKSYIDIQLLLNDNAFDVAYQIDPQLPDLEVPNLLLQPLVENAIVHGILPNRSKRGKLFLSVTRVNDKVHFAILDNGLGIPAEKIPLLTQTQSGGYGLKNVHERLQLIYGEEYGLTINSILNESTMITFSIPVLG